MATEMESNAYDWTNIIGSWKLKAYHFKWRSIRLWFPILINFMRCFRFSLSQRAIYLYKKGTKSSSSGNAFSTNGNHFVGGRSEEVAFHQHISWSVMKLANDELFLDLIKSHVTIIDEWHIVSECLLVPFRREVKGVGIRRSLWWWRVHFSHHSRSLIYFSSRPAQLFTHLIEFI